MKRVLSLVLALVLVLGMVPVFANELTSDSLDLLKEFNVAQGDAATGDLRLDDTLTRAEMIVLLSRMFDVEETAKGFDGVYPFEDINDDQWWTPYIAYAFEQGWTTGTSATTFNPAGIATGKEVLIFAMRALGHKDFGKAEAGLTAEELKAEAAKVGLSVTSFGEVLRGEVFGLVYTTLFVVENVDGEILAEKFFGWVAPAPVVTELEVVSVSATNLKEVVVEFNQEVDKDTVVNANFVVKRGNVTVPTAAQLAENGTTVVLTVTPIPQSSAKMENQTAHTVTIEKVKSVSGETIVKTTEGFTTFDGTLPVVEGMTYVGPRHMQFTFSEPIADTGSYAVTVRAGNSSISVDRNNITGWGTNVLTVPTFSNFVEETVYSINVTGFEDFAGYKNVAKTFEENFVKDVTPPVATVVKATQEYVVVEFDKPVSGVSRTHFSHTFTAWNAIRITAEEKLYVNNALDTEISSGTRFVVWFHDAITTDATLRAANRPIEAGTRNLNILSKNASNVEIKDLWGNKLADTTIQFTVAADTEAPKVTELKVISERAFTIEFNKNVTLAKSNIEILDKDGKAVSGLTFELTGSGRNYTVTMGKNYPGETFIINIKGVRDTTLLTNAMPTYTETIVIGDKTAPRINKATIEEVVVPGGTNYFNVYVFFNEDMDADTTLVASNYQLMATNGSAFTSLTGTPEFVNGVRTVRIRLTAAQKARFDAPNNQTNIFVSNVKDVAGNAIELKVAAIVDHTSAIQPKFDSVLDSNGDPILNSAKVHATGDKQIKIFFNQELATVNSTVVIGGTAQDAFVVTGATGQKVNSINVDVVGGKTVVTLNLNQSLQATYDDNGALFITDDLIVRAGAVVNLFGTPNAELSIETALDGDDLPVVGAIIYDKNPPRVALHTVNSQEVSNVQHVDGTIEVTFTERLDDEFAALYAQDLVIVRGTTTLTPGVHYETVLDTDNAVLIIKALSGDLQDNRYTVATRSTVTYIKDTNGNMLAPFSAIAVNVNKATQTVATGIAPPTFSVGTTSQLPTVAAGYTVSVKTTATASVYSASGVPLTAGTSVVVYTVTHTATGVTADTGNLTVTVTP